MLIGLWTHQMLLLFYAINDQKGFVIAHMTTQPRQAYATHSDVKLLGYTRCSCHHIQIIL